MKKLILITTIILTSVGLNAKEPTNIMLGIGGGVGMTTMNINHSFAMRYPIKDRDYTKHNWEGENAWLPQQNRSLSSWSGAWEFLAGYKHFVNDYLGVRAYGIVGFQHYKPSLYESKTDPIGIIDYSINTDLLVNFYENESFSIGILGGLGMGGASFTSDAISKYIVVYDRDTGTPVAKTDVKKHFLNINASAGIRATYFQKIRKVSERVCDENYIDGKRLCKVPVSYIGHSFEINAKFNVLNYNANAYPDILTVNGKTVSKPQYVIKNPYRITLRYIIDF